MRALPRVVDERLVATAMDLSPREPSSLKPPPVQRAELRAPVALVGGLGKVFEVQQLERHAWSAMLAMDRLEVRQRVLALCARRIGSLGVAIVPQGSRNSTRSSNATTLRSSRSRCSGIRTSPSADNTAHGIAATWSQPLWRGWPPPRYRAEP
jgi:hypothetical protein